MKWLTRDRVVHGSAEPIPGFRAREGDWSDEETRDPLYTYDRNFYKVEQWTRDGMAVDCLLYAGNSLAKAEDIFGRAIKHRPRIRLTIPSARACCNSTRSEIQKADDGNTVRHLIG